MFSTGSRLLAVLVSLQLCSCSLYMKVPLGFLQLQTSGSELKAQSPDEARLWVREFHDHDQGKLEFWAKALSRDLIESRGYQLTDTRAVKDLAKRQGTELRFTTNLGGTQRGYMIAIFVFEGSRLNIFAARYNIIRVVEFTAEKAVFDRYIEAVHLAIASLGP